MARPQGGCMSRSEGIGGPKHGNKWKGGEVICGNRVRLFIPSHPRSNQNGYVSKSIFIAENVLGKPLTINAIVHHIDENPLNNNNDNLVICQDRAYHALIHARKKALYHTGNPNKRKCVYCKEWDDISNLGKHSSKSNTFCHWRCSNASRRKQTK